MCVTLDAAALLVRLHVADSHVISKKQNGPESFLSEPFHVASAFRGNDDQGLLLIFSHDYQRNEISCQDIFYSSLASVRQKTVFNHGQSAIFQV